MEQQKTYVKKALIMAGGFGSRMGELTKDKPKPMLQFHGKTILEHSIDLCKRFLIREIAISIFYFGEQIKEYFGDGSRFGVNIIYVEEKEPLGTGGALKLCKDWLNEPFMMCNADELKDINLQEMYRQHISTGATATIALTEVKDPSMYGVVELENQKIKRFVEKPKIDEVPSKWINAGLYILNPEVAGMVPEGYCMVEKDIFPKLAQEGKLFGFKFNGQWFDTGTLERYLTAHRSWNGFKEKPLFDFIPEKSQQSKIEVLISNS